MLDLTSLDTATRIILVIARVLGVLVAIPVHEVSHAFVSDKLGDHTARSMGRLTLNPIKHIDPFGLLMMLVAGVGWAKPVPVNPAYYKNKKAGMALTALAGPASNLLLALVTLVVYKVFAYGALAALGGSLAGGPYWVTAVQLVLYYFTLTNISLALFNLIPIPPLDGSRILWIWLPDKWYFGVMRYERYIMMALLAAIVVLPYIVGFSPLGWLLGDVRNAIYDGMWWLTGFVDRILVRLIF